MMGGLYIVKFHDLGASHLTYQLYKLIVLGLHDLPIHYFKKKHYFYLCFLKATILSCSKANISIISISCVSTKLNSHKNKKEDALLTPER